MSPHEFMFEVAVPDAAHFETMLSDVAAAVFAHVGYTPRAVAELTAEMRAAMNNGASPGQHCRVAFHASHGQLQIAIARDDEAEWRTARSLP